MIKFKKTLLSLVIVFSTQVLYAKQELYADKELNNWIKHSEEKYSLITPVEPKICQRKICSLATALCDSAKNLKSNKNNIGSFLVVFTHLSATWFNDKLTK